MDRTNWDCRKKLNSRSSQTVTLRNCDHGINRDYVFMQLRRIYLLWKGEINSRMDCWKSRSSHSLLFSVWSWRMNKDLIYFCLKIFQLWGYEWMKMCGMKLGTVWVKVWLKFERGKVNFSLKTYERYKNLVQNIHFLKNESIQMKFVSIRSIFNDFINFWRSTVD